MTRHVRGSCLRALLGAACAVQVVTAPAGAGAQEPVRLIASSAERGVVLRWAWGDGERAVGWLLERRTGTGAWSRITPQPIRRVRDRGAARAALGERFARFEGLLFPEDPRAELADPDSHRSLHLMAADVDADVARLFGLRFDDVDAPAGARHEYRLIAVMSAGERLAATSDAITAGAYAPPAGPDSLRALQGRVGISLRWQAAPEYSAYHVYRSPRADGRNAVRLNGTPVVIFFEDAGARTQSAATYFTDSVGPAANDTAWYQVEGIDAFGRSSRRTPSVGATRLDLEAPAPPLGLQARVAGDTVVVSWSPSPATDVAALQVWRSESAAGPFAPVGGRLGATASEFRDAARPARRLSWYRVTAIDRAGHAGDPSAMAMAEVADLAAPPVPAGLRGVADTGRITLSWSRVDAPDLLGYRVYRSSVDSGTYSMLPDSLRREPLLIDRIPSAADHAYFYRVSAVDSAFNESAQSAVVAVRPPDAAAPRQPRITALRRGDASLVVEWLPNVEPDLVGYRVLHRAERATAWTEAPALVRAPLRTRTITGLLPGQRYEVALVAVDDAGNASPVSESLRAAPFDRAVGAPDLRRVRYDEARRGVRLEWEAPSDGVVELLVLRREPEGTYRPIGSLASGATSFIDATVRTGREYEYVLRARDHAGRLIDSRSRSATVPGAAR